MDAEQLAFLLRGDLLPMVWIPPVAVRHAKELLRDRFLLVRFQMALRNQLNSLLRKRNLLLFPSSLLFTQQGYAYLEGSA